MSTIVINRGATGLAVGRGARRTSSREGVRLTPRGRVVLVGLALALALLAGVMFGGGSVATGEAGTDVPTRVLVVAEGDTLWGLAADVADDGEVREVMREIRRLNALDSSLLQLGQKLRVPLATR